ncbi:MAG: CRISPR-associated endonuclease Cas3'', partial [Chloroflexota bacterium]
PDVTNDWVEAVHRKEDSVSLRRTWRGQLEECLKRIERNALVKDAVGVADLIRGDDTERVSVIVAEEASLPGRPVEREGMSLSRWSLARLLTPGQQSPGWFWDLSNEIASWRPLQNRDDLRNSYAICLKTGVAAYDQHLGLRLGERGDQESPLRTAPPRPGHAPLHAEPWVEHARNVGEECRRRFDAEFPLLSVFVAGMRTRFGLAREDLAALVQLAGFLHDLGKLNRPWQQWAEAAQRMADPSKLALLPLAHTDYDSDSPEDRDRAVALKAIGLHRPPHAAQGAYLIRAWHGSLLGGLPPDVRAKAISACAAAIIAHHGGWLPAEIQLFQLADRWDHGIKEKLGFSVPEQNIPSVLKVADKDKSREVKRLLDLTTHPDELSKWWPLVSYLTRTLRLSDQRSTAEGGDG